MVLFVSCTASDTLAYLSALQIAVLNVDLKASAVSVGSLYWKKTPRLSEKAFYTLTCILRLHFPPLELEI